MSSPQRSGKTPGKRKHNSALVALIVVLLAMSAFVAFKKRLAANANSAVNYDDPNMQKTNELVNEATASCLQKEADAQSDIPSCINNYKGAPASDAKAKTSSEVKTEPAAESTDLSTAPARTSTPN